MVLPLRSRHCPRRPTHEAVSALELNWSAVSILMPFQQIMVTHKKALLITWRQLILCRRLLPSSFWSTSQHPIGESYGGGSRETRPSHCWRPLQPLQTPHADRTRHWSFLRPIRDFLVGYEIAPVDRQDILSATWVKNVKLFLLTFFLTPRNIIHYLRPTKLDNTLVTYVATAE